MSLAPSSTITRSGFAPSPSSVHASRARPAALVSPDDAAIGDARGDAVAAQGCLQLRRKAKPGIKAITRGQAVAERQDQRFGGRSAGGRGEQCGRDEQ